MPRGKDSRLTDPEMYEEKKNKKELTQSLRNH